jgi:hypothetical protein
MVSVVAASKPSASITESCFGTISVRPPSGGLTSWVVTFL